MLSLGIDTCQPCVESNLYAWKQPWLFVGSHGTPLANNLISCNPFQVLESLGNENCPQLELYVLHYLVIHLDFLHICIYFRKLVPYWVFILYMVLNFSFLSLCSFPNCSFPLCLILPFWCCWLSSINNYSF